MKKIIPFFIMICCLLAVSSCSYDNFEEPKATLTGKAIYDGEAVGVRSGSSEFALFQDGYALQETFKRRNAIFANLFGRTYRRRNDEGRRGR